MKVIKTSLAVMVIGALILGLGLQLGVMQRAFGSAKVHVGEPKPEAAASAPAGSPAAAGQQSNPALAVSSARPSAAPSASARASEAPVPGAASHRAPRPEDDRLMIVRDAEPLALPQAQTSASMAAASQPGPSPAKPGGASRDPGRHAIASRDGAAAGAASVRYGGGDRAQLMGRGAGPVYNLRAASGGGQADGGSVSARQLATVMQNAESQLDSTNLTPEARAMLKKQLESVNNAAQTQQSAIGR